MVALGPARALLFGPDGQAYGHLRFETDSCVTIPRKGPQSDPRVKKLTNRGSVFHMRPNSLFLREQRYGVCQNRTGWLLCGFKILSSRIHVPSPSVAVLWLLEKPLALALRLRLSFSAKRIIPNIILFVGKHCPMNPPG